MSRVKRGVTKHRSHKKVFALAKGYWGARRNHIKPAKETVLHALDYAYRHRRERKGDMRRLWIMRINAAARLSGIPYGRFMEGLKKAQVQLNRQVLADMAVKEPQAFAQLARLAQETLAQPGS